MGGTPPSLTAITKQTSSRRCLSLVAFSSMAGKRCPLAAAPEVAGGRGKGVAHVIK
jgi:hypothetical protein